MDTEQLNSELTTNDYSNCITRSGLSKDSDLIKRECSTLRNSHLSFDKVRLSLQLDALGDSCSLLVLDKESRPANHQSWIDAVEKGEVNEANIESTRQQLVQYGFRPAFIEQLGLIGRCSLLTTFQSKLRTPKRLPSDLKNSPHTHKEIIDADSNVIDFAMPQIRRNVLTNEISYTTDGGKRHILQGSDLNTIHLRIATLVDGSIPKDRARDQVIFKADSNPWNPGLDFINECRRFHDLNVEEAKEIVFSIAKTYLHNDEELPNKVLGLWLMAHACNTLDIDGCHAPEYLPILAGEQGCYKSSFLRILFGGLTKERSLTTVVSTDPAAFFKDVTLVSTAWFMEFPEIERWLTKSHLNAFKGRVTDPYPEGRRPYDALPTKFKRLSAWAGTTNNPQGILIDRSSAYDRRFIPIQIPAGKFIETQLLEENLSKLWAAVMVCVENGVVARPHTLPADLYKDLAEYQEPFQDESPLQATLLAYARGVNEVNTMDALRCCFGLSEVEVSEDLLNEAKSIFRKYLTAHGFTSKRKRVNKVRTYTYERDVKLTSHELECNRLEVNKGRSNSIRFDPIRPRSKRDVEVEVDF